MSPKAAINRRDQFRHFMESLTTGAIPSQAIEQGLYVPAPGGAVAERLVPRIDLRPASTHIVVGGIGTGKTTQLLMAVKKLEELPDVHPLYVDVSAHHDLGQLKNGVLVVIAGLTLDRLMTAAQSDAAMPVRRRFRKWADGYTTWFEQDYYEAMENADDYDPQHFAVAIPGELIPPEPPLDGDLPNRIQALQELILGVQSLQNKRHILLLIDSLDRVTDLDAFSEVVIHDVRALRDAGVGVVLVGPLRVLFGTHRPITDRFDHTYHVPAVDTSTENGPAFLGQVLRLRAPSGILTAPAISDLARLSGGVLRDLIGLTQSSGEEAYIAGSDSVTPEHVAKAADAFGRNLMLGLGADEVEVLQRVRQKGTFIQTSDKDIALLVTRRVLEYGEGHARYAVHPTIEPLLDQLATK